MAEKNRKSNRNFNIEKPVSRHFDIEKEDKKPVISTPIPEKKSDIPNNKSKQGAQSTTQTSEKQHRAWIWVVILIVVAIVAFFCLRNCGNKENVETSSTLPTPNVDSIQDKEVAAEISGNEEVSGKDKAFNNADRPTHEDPKTVSPNNGKAAPATLSENKEDAKGPSKMKNRNQVTSNYASRPSVSINDDVEENALRAIRGDFGNGIDRKNALGDKYAEVQKRINEIYKEQYSNN